MRSTPPSPSPPAQPLWLPSMAPRSGLALATVAALVLVVAATQLALRQPSLGIVWGRADGGGLTVAAVADTVAIPPGTRIVALQSLAGQRVPLNDGMRVEDPDQLATYADYNRFFADQVRLWGLYTQAVVVLLAADGQKWPLTAQPDRTLAQLPAAFWILSLPAAAFFLIGSGIWLWRRGTGTGRLLAVTGLGYFLSILCLSVYGCRELVMEPQLMRALSAVNHLCTLTWCFSLLLMLAIYPAPIGGRRTICLCYLAAGAIWLNQTWQWIEMPVHAYYLLTHIASYLVGVVLGGMQWARTSRRPVERAILRWFILSILVNIGVAGALFIAPAIIGDTGAIPLWVPALSVFFMFIGFAFGILRCGLFSLEKWWFTGWVWLLSGALITAVDALLVLLLGVRFETLLPYSILLLGWIYFPLRHWLWRRFVKPETHYLEHHLPTLIQSLMDSDGPQSYVDKWSSLLRQVYTPLELIVAPHDGGGPVEIRRHGLELRIPGIDGRHRFRLIGNRRGSRLFGPREVELGSALLSISQGIFAITRRTRVVQQQGAEEERARIMRDLHDDVLPKLITIMHRAPSAGIAGLAEKAFQSIRETIYILRYPEDRPLAEALADWRGELAERLEPSGLTLIWQAPDRAAEVRLTSRQFVNCGRILREGVSNIIRHARATRVQISFAVERGQLHLVIGDDGTAKEVTDAAAAQKGMGMRNMRLRAEALSGNIAWWRNRGESGEMASGLTVSVSIPLAHTDDAAAQKARVKKRVLQ